MSLKNMETGQAATPLEQLQKINEIRRAETENGLLKEALAISNEKCNGLISKQNMLIADLTTNVNEIKSDNSFYLKRQSENVQSAVKEIREITQDERKFKAEVSQTIKSEIGRTVADAKAIHRERNRTRARGYADRERFPQVYVLGYARTFICAERIARNIALQPQLNI